MTMNRTRLIDEARATLQTYHGDRDADDVTLIDAVDLLTTLAGLTYLVDDAGAVTLEPNENATAVDAAVRFLPGDGADALPCVVVGGVQVYSSFDDEGLLQVSVDTEDADGLVPIEFAVNGNTIASLPGTPRPDVAAVSSTRAAIRSADGDDTITELAELEALPVGSVIKLPDGEVGMVMVARDKRHVIGYPGVLPTSELPEVIRSAYGDPITVVWRSGRAAT